MSESLSSKSSGVPVQRRPSASNVSMKDWTARQLTIHDVEQMINLHEADDPQTYRVIHGKLQTRLPTYHGPNPFVHVLPFTCYERYSYLQSFANNLQTTVDIS